MYRTTWTSLYHSPSWNFRKNSNSSRRNSSMKNPKGFKKSLRKRSHHLLERTYSLRAKNEKLKYERMMIVDLKHFNFFRCTKRHTFKAGSPPNVLHIYIIQQFSFPVTLWFPFLVLPFRVTGARNLFCFFSHSRSLVVVVNSLKWKQKYLSENIAIFTKMIIFSPNTSFWTKKKCHDFCKTTWE